MVPNKGGGQYQKSAQYDVGNLSIAIGCEDVVNFPLRLRREVNIEVDNASTKSSYSTLLKPLFPYPGRDISFDGIDNGKRLGELAESVIYDSCTKLFPEPSSAYHRMLQHVLKLEKTLKDGLVEATGVGSISIDTDKIMERMENGIYDAR